MTHLYIELNTGLTEEVNSSIISKLYELAISGDLDNTSDLKGRLHTTACKDIYYEYLTGSVNGTKRFPDLYITADNLYISFVDSVAELICVSNWGTSDGVTNTQLQAVVNNDLTANGPFVLTNIVNFPEFSKFTGITKLNNNVFLQCTQLQSITLPSSCTELGRAVFYGDTALSQINLSNIESIDAQCFLNCSSLSSTINLPNLTTIKGGGVFDGCTSLTKVTGLSNITSIPELTFNNCTNLTSVDIDWTKITSIEGGAFKNTSISGNIVLSSLTSLGGGYETGAFRDCKNLTSADLSGSTITLMTGTFCGCTNLTSATIPNTLTKIKDRTFRDSGITSIDLKNVTEISYSAFLNSKLTSVDLSNIVHITGYDAFNGCTSLTSVTFPSTPFDWFDDYGASQFNKQGFLRGCTSLTSADLSNALSLCKSMFQNDSALTTVNLSAANITVIPEEFCYHCSNLTSLGEKITPTYIGDRAFEGCTLIDNNDIGLSAATYIGHRAMNNTAISGVLNLTECLTLGENPFDGCTGITEIHAPKVTDIDSYSTWKLYSNLEVLDLPVSTRINDFQNNPKLTTINAPLATKFNTYLNGKCCFSNCPLLSTLNINFSAVTALGSSCFYNDTGLNGQYLYFPNVTSLESEALKSNAINFVFANNSIITLTGYGWFTSYTGTVYVPDNLVDTYKTTSEWSSIANLIKGISELPNS